MRCPRCRAELGDSVPAFCRGCGAPLRLEEEAAPRPLQASLTLDRRATRPAGADDTFEEITPAALAAAVPAEPARPPGRRDELEDVERSRWDLRVPPPVPPAGTTAVEAPRARRARGPGEGAVDSDVDVEAVEVHLRRPPPWRRAVAGLVDLAPFAAGGWFLARALVRAAGSGLPAPPTGLDGLLDLLARERVIVAATLAVVALALGTYATLAHALAGATLGKRLLRLRIVGPDGQRPTLARSAIRSALVVLSAALLGLGVLLALFSRSGRALHDLLARTWVVEAL